MSREIDALVAERVMGYGSRVKMFVSGPIINDAYPVAVPNYSTDIAAAWQVVEKMREIACQVDVTSHGEHEVVLAHGVVCYIHGFNEDFWREGMLDADYSAVADTAPMAICLAALRAINVELPKENA